MTNQQILEKAIQKVMDGGWSTFGVSPSKPIEVDENLLIGEFKNWHYPDIIFLHDFAKALWGEQEQDWDGEGYTTPDWQYHLQQMVIAEDPIAYLGENM